MKLALLTGILIGTSYIPFPPWALLFCLVPLWTEWLQNPSPKSVFKTGWLAQFVLTLIGFHWISWVAVEFGHLPWAVGILVALLFASFASLHLPLSGLLWAWVNKRFQLKPVYSIVFLAFSFWVMESLLPMIFPWNLGYPWIWSGLPIYQTADVFGFEGLSLINALFNVLFFWAWKNRADRTHAVQFILAAVIAFGALNMMGVWRKSQLPPYDSEVKTLILQGNIGNLEKAIAERGSQFREPILNKYFSLTREALAKYPETELVFYPETAIPIELDTHFAGRPYPQRFRIFNQEIKKPILAGAYSGELNTNAVFNSVFLFNENGDNLGKYQKTILLAFGEYFPGAQYFPFLKKIVPAISDFKSGSGPSILQWNELKIGPLICYEGLHPWFIHGLVDKGAQVFFNVSNDSWYGRPFEPLQHLYMTLARAIEFRRPLVRSTNTGITTAILPDGTILEKSPQDQEWAGLFAVKYWKEGPNTPFNIYGRFLIWLGPIALALLILLGQQRAKP